MLHGPRIQCPDCIPFHGRFICENMDTELACDDNFDIDDNDFEDREWLSRTLIPARTCNA